MSSARIWQALHSAVNVVGNVAQSISASIFHVVEDDKDDDLIEANESDADFQHQQRSYWRSMYDASELPTQSGEWWEGNFKI